MSSIRFAWRNMWRNKRRTVITLIALAANTAILIATFALMEGYVHNAISYVTDLILGEAQIHKTEYLEDNSIYRTIDNPAPILARAESLGIKATPRLYGYGLLSSGKKSAGALFTGIYPDSETQAFSLDEHVMEGEFLKSDSAKKVVLGKKLAKTLDVTIGSELVVLVQAADGSLGTDIFFVDGILKAAGDKIDRATAFFRQEDFRELFVMDASMNMQDSVHEIALNSFGKVELSKMKGKFADVTGDLEFKTWKELNPSIAEFMYQAEKSIIIFAWIFFIVAALGIMNTMLMATYDRIRELGILKAIGATPLRILTDVLTEAVLLTILATVFGLIAGVLLSWYFQVHGIDTRGTGGDMSFAGVAFDPIWKASLSLRAIYIPVTMMWAISVLGAFYPASIAARLKPVEAINHI